VVTVPPAVLAMVRLYVIVVVGVQLTIPAIKATVSKKMLTLAK
jgi:hypothetical protein